ncbi:hypothetical protein QBC45DRAFT_339725, partial [Copromyces sp. CBS 386.78]
VLKYRNLAAKNGVYDIRCHPAARPTFWWGLRASRCWGACGKDFSLVNGNLVNRRYLTFVNNVQPS